MHKENRKNKDFLSIVFVVLKCQQFYVANIVQEKKKQNFRGEKKGEREVGGEGGEK